ncbi:MAG: hypothetical protein ACRCXZ_00575 [Patescibacteria group bacterium]
MLFLFSPIISLGQVSAQDFNLTLPKVTQSGVIKETEKIGADYLFNDVLTLNDSLRFAWSNIDLDLDSRSNKSTSKGYIKAYVNTIADENFILDFATSPIKMDTFSQKLKEGSNKLYFVLYVNGEMTQKRFGFSFVFKATNNDPSIKIVKPNANIVFTEDSKYDFQVNVENMIIRSGINIGNHGKINVFINSTSEENFLTQVTEADINGNTSYLKFNSSIFSDKIKQQKDELKSKLIFQPVSNIGKVFTNSEVTLDVITNYNKTLDIKQPAIEFLNINDNTAINKDEKIKFKISNFKTLKLETRNTVTPNEGYLQILINDKPHKIAFDKTEFTIQEIAPNYTSEKINLKLQLLNVDFTELNPNISTSADVFIKNSQKQNIESRIQTSNWRLIIIGVTILMIILSVLFIIFRT